MTFDVFDFFDFCLFLVEGYKRKKIVMGKLKWLQNG